MGALLGVDGMSGNQQTNHCTANNNNNQVQYNLKNNNNSVAQVKKFCNFYTRSSKDFPRLFRDAAGYNLRRFFGGCNCEPCAIAQTAPPNIHNPSHFPTSSQPAVCTHFPRYHWEARSLTAYFWLLIRANWNQTFCSFLNLLVTLTVVHLLTQAAASSCSYPNILGLLVACCPPCLLRLPPKPDLGAQPPS
jgi:hypothetical protein